jgi:hypothetical protein
MEVGGLEELGTVSMRRPSPFEEPRQKPGRIYQTKKSGWALYVITWGIEIKANPKSWY